MGASIGAGQWLAPLGKVVFMNSDEYERLLNKTVDNIAFYLSACNIIKKDEILNNVEAVNYLKYALSMLIINCHHQ